MTSHKKRYLKNLTALYKIGRLDLTHQDVMKSMIAKRTLEREYKKKMKNFNKGVK